MRCYRGINDPPATKYLNAGFTYFPKHQAPTGNLYAWFVARLKEIGKVSDLGFKWRVTTPGGLVATAVPEEGAFEAKPYVYQIEYPDSELYFFRFEKANKNGAPSGSEPLSVRGESVDLATRKSYGLVANAPVVTDATVLAFYHGEVTTRELTFMSEIPRNKIIGWREGGTEKRGKFAAMPPVA